MSADTGPTLWKWTIRTSLMMGKRRHNFLDLPLNDFNHRYAVWILSFLHWLQKRLILGVITGFWTFFVWWSFSVSILIVVGLNNAMHYLRKTSNIDSRLQGVIPIRWFEPTCIMTVGPINSLRPKAALFEDLCEVHSFGKLWIMKYYAITSLLAALCYS